MKKITVGFIFTVALFIAGEYLYSQSIGKIGFPAFAGLALIWFAVGVILLSVAAVIYKKSEAEK